jgi:predicted DCC family thiol-disulfide oxidoreductase YuxK
MLREAHSYRGDPAVPAFPDCRPIVIFDGDCVMCSAFAQLIMRRDPEKRFRLLAARTPLGAALYTHFGLVADDYESNILLEDGRAYIKSEGSIRILERLGMPWSLIRVARVLPLPLRDRIYQFIARNRLRWFGRRQACYRPEPSQADRFIEGEW